jgi:hypothetical protein
VRCLLDLDVESLRQLLQRFSDVFQYMPPIGNLDRHRGASQGAARIAIRALATDRFHAGGCPSLSRNVSNSRSIKSSSGWCRSKSTITRPYGWPRRNALSSTQELLSNAH